MKKLFTIFLITLTILSCNLNQNAYAVNVRLKDISHIEGIRDNQLVGYGVVVGLSGTGDNSRSTQITNQAMLSNLGTIINSSNDIKKGNTAAVRVTANIPPFAKNGDKIDVVVSSLADAKSLEGGVLVQTQLLAPNGEVIAVAQGPLSTGGADVSSGGSSTRTSIVTSGRVPNGAIVERDIYTEIGDDFGLRLILNKSDFTMAAKIASTISNTLAPSKAVDGSTIQINIPEKFLDDKIRFISILENIKVQNGDSVAKVIINERTGTIVIGNEVKLSPAAIAHGNLTVTVSSKTEVSQPNPFSDGNTALLQNNEVTIEKEEGKIIEVPSNTNLSELVRALNTIGVSPYDLISILQALKAAGSLQATLEII
ncbi:MAG: flagellar basal body P-ring protein FlgI [Candidatus Gastranaerophilales bacterium]|nr:flagellar basal body P-ring protein FlgI [Candidatus Gastranaerophilales bacterium]